MDSANTTEIIQSIIVSHLKATKYLMIYIRMIINTMLPTLIINFQGLLKNQVYQVKEVVLMMMEPNVSLALVCSTFEDKKRELLKLKL
jgi:hypothetical protein